MLALEQLGERPYGGSMRVSAAVAALTDLGFDVRVVAPAGSRPIGSRLHETGIGRLKRKYLPMPTTFGARSPELVRTLRESGPSDLVVCQAFQQSSYLMAARTRLRWLDFGDLQSEFCRKEASERVAISRLSSRAQTSFLAHGESRRARTADIVSCAGFGDAVVLRGRGINAEWLPTPVTGISLPRRSSDKTIRIGFIGNFQYWPNVLAYEMLACRWLPSWRPHAEVWVAGYGSEQLDLRDGVRILGSVQDVAEFYSRVDIVAAPVERGGGMKVKVAEALIFNRPVLASANALEGFSPELRELCVSVDREIPNLDALRGLAARALPNKQMESLRYQSYLDHTARLLNQFTSQLSG